MTHELLLNDLWQSSWPGLAEARLSKPPPARRGLLRGRGVRPAPPICCGLSGLLPGRHGTEVDKRVGCFHRACGPFQRRFAEAIAQMRPLDGASRWHAACRRPKACGGRAAHPAGGWNHCAEGWERSKEQQRPMAPALRLRPPMPTLSAGSSYIKALDRNNRSNRRSRASEACLGTDWKSLRQRALKRDV